MRICKDNKELFLRKHMMTHTGETPHKCNFCGKGFRRKDTLKKHEVKKIMWLSFPNFDLFLPLSACTKIKGPQINLNSCCFPGGPFPWRGQVQVPLFRMWKALHTADQSENPPEKPPPPSSATSTAPWTTSIARRSRSSTPRPTRRGKRTACPTKLKRGF